MHVVSKLIVTGVLSITLISCGISDANRIRSGDSPQHRDEDVAFRTIYYFRVFDYCYNKNILEKKSSKIAMIPRSEGLYRFTMTGKANQLANKVKFESGILDSAQIDPFGAAIVYDKSLGSHRFVGTNEKENIRRLSDTEDAIDKLIAMKNLDKDGKYDTKFKESIEKLITHYADEVLRQSGVEDPRQGDEQQSDDSGNKDLAPNIQVSQTISCPKEATIRKGFQVLGPEGWRTFNPDERLILAMTTSAKPLISTMKELSGRVLEKKASDDRTLLQLAQEQRVITNARFELLSSKKPDSDKILESYRNGAIKVCKQLVSGTDVQELCKGEQE